MPVKMICKTCGKEFKVQPRDIKRGKNFCSYDCWREYQKRYPKKISSICQFCGKSFQHHANRKGIYCSKQCKIAGLSKRTKVPLICPTCKKEFIVNRCEAKTRKFCSLKCFYKSISDHRPGTLKTKNCEMCGKPFNYPIWREGEARFCSHKCAGIAFRGKGSKRYKGIYKNPADLRKALHRSLKWLYGDRCAICGWDKTPNDVCHIVPRSKGGKGSLDNVVFLCPNHHRMLDMGLIQREHLFALVQKQRHDIANFSQLTRIIQPLSVDLLANNFPIKRDQ